MNGKVTLQRVSLKRVRPNPLFEDWVANMYEEAKTKKSKLEPMLKEAMDSLSAYPMKLRSGEHCKVLKGFREQLRKYLDMCLKQYDYNFELSRYCALRLDYNIKHPESSSTSSPLPTNKNRVQVQCTAITSASGSNQNTDDRSVNNSMSDSLRKCLRRNSQASRIELAPAATSIADVDNLNTQTKSVSPTISRKGKIKSKSTIYQPAHRSGAYAILVALLEQVLEKPDKPALTQDKIIEKAQKHCEESFIRPKPESFYTAWSNMTRLVTKGLVEKLKNKRKVEYLLTEEGIELARRILEQAKGLPTVNDQIFNDAPVNQEQNSVVMDDGVTLTSQNYVNNNNIVFEMAPGTFDIILLIDKNETGGLKKKYDPTVAQFNKYPDLKHEYRSLKVGDFTWIARHKVNQEQELVLPFVVERKRMDDLGASIKDGRFHEQKFRLRKCGLDSVIYMVENFGKNKHVGLPVQTLMQALVNTRVQDGFKVHMTDSLTNSARFLAMMTKRLTIRFKDKFLRGCNDDFSGDNLMTFEYFNKSSAKTKPLTVTETFIKLLLQLKGVSVEKALAITSKYPTPRSLILAYAECDRKEGECLLAHLKYGDLNRNVGPITSKSIYLLFSNTGQE